MVFQVIRNEHRVVLQWILCYRIFGTTGVSIYGVLKLKECARAEIMKQLEYLSMIRQRKSIDHTERVRGIGIC